MENRKHAERQQQRNEALPVPAIFKAGYHVASSQHQAHLSGFFIRQHENQGEEGQYVGDVLISRNSPGKFAPFNHNLIPGHRKRAPEHDYGVGCSQ